MSVCGTVLESQAGLEGSLRGRADLSLSVGQYLGRITPREQLVPLPHAWFTGQHKYRAAEEAREIKCLPEMQFRDTCLEVHQALKLHTDVSTKLRQVQLPSPAQHFQALPQTLAPYVFLHRTDGFTRWHRKMGLGLLHGLSASGSGQKNRSSGYALSWLTRNGRNTSAPYVGKPKSQNTSPAASPTLPLSGSQPSAPSAILAAWHKKRGHSATRYRPVGGG